MLCWTDLFNQLIIFLLKQCAYDGNIRHSLITVFGYVRFIISKSFDLEGGALPCNFHGVG